MAKLKKIMKKKAVEEYKQLVIKEQKELERLKTANRNKEVVGQDTKELVNSFKQSLKDIKKTDVTNSAFQKVVWPNFSEIKPEPRRDININLRVVKDQPPIKQEDAYDLMMRT